jgi:hypothetical protein
MPAIQRLQEIVSEEDGYEAAGVVVDSILSAGDDDGPECAEVVPTHVERDADGTLTRVLVSIHAVPETGKSIEGDERALVTAAH